MLDPFAARFRGCLVDEHYYGTLFAMHGRQLETDCKGVLTVAHFRYVTCLLPSQVNVHTADSLQGRR